MTAHGLHYPDGFLAALPVLLPRPAPHAPIRALTAAQFATLRHRHLTADVPDSVLFPFLHGLEGDNPAQNLFFAKHGSTVAVPDYRGLVWVLCDDDEPADGAADDDELPDEGIVCAHRRCSDASSLSSSAESLFSQSVSSLSTAATSLSSQSSKPSRTTHLLSSAFRPADLLTASPDGPVFVPPAVPKGISLRNFGIQVPVYATLSDIVVYSPRGATRAAFALAERFKCAIEAKCAARWPHLSPYDPRPVAYNVFIISDPFSVFERDFPELVAVTSTGVPVNHISFPDREMQEMQELTRATEVYPGVWVGNSADVPLWEHGDPDAPFDAARNPNGYDICVECHDQAPFPHTTLLKQAEDHLAALDALWATGYAAGQALFTTTAAPTAAPAPARPPPNANTIIHFSFPSAPPSIQSTMSFLSPFLTFLQSVLHRPRPCRVLIYSHDGYTESSVLTLALLMAEKHCSLPEAYLELQVVRGRSFFVHQCDLGILKRVEAKYVSRVGDKEKQRDAERAGRERWGWSSLMSRSNTLGFGSSSSTASSTAGQLSTSIPTPSHTDTPHRRARAQTSPLLPALVDHQSWFNDIRFDGSFPSRVLPFLYLGNLNHASNAYMLHALGITHVVSVGECALVPPLTEEECANGSGNGEYYANGNGNGMYHVHGKENGNVSVSGMPGSLWREEREGRIKVLDIKGVCDDGIDSLRPTFSSICDWIDQARLAGGQVLVHCRVGVSRSATVTIAYVMKHLSLSLVDAYLIVRSRRLSVLIQPNMRLLYNLCGWEVELARLRLTEEKERRLRQRGCKGKIESGDKRREGDACMGDGKRLEGGDKKGPQVGDKQDRRMEDGDDLKDWCMEDGDDEKNRRMDDTDRNDDDKTHGEHGKHERHEDSDDNADEDEEAALRHALKKGLNWPYLCREVHLLNEKYLH